MNRLAATRTAVSAARSGFSLMELITAMLASTVLVASLAATVVISTQLLEVPPADEADWHDRYIADRLASDLRYATGVHDNTGYGLEINKLDSAAGLPVTVTYEAAMDGMTRQVSGGPVVNLDPVAPGQQFFVDGYSAPTYVTPETCARIRSSSTATTASAAASVDVGVPPGCKAGDLVLLCVSAKTPSTLSVSDAGWEAMQTRSVSDLRLITFYRIYDPSWAPTLTVSVSPDSAIAAAMVAIENVDPASPINWTGGHGGYAWSFLPATHPTPLEVTGFNNRQLNVQIFAADSDPWYDGALGMAGFTDAVQATAAPGDPSRRNTLGVVIRNGAAPDLSTTPRLFHQISGYWLQAAARVEAAP